MLSDHFVKRYVSILFFMIFTVAAFFFAENVPVPTYVGAAKCKGCHQTKSQGRQFSIWESSKHAQAFNALKSDEAKITARTYGESGPPEKAPACLKCHAPVADKFPQITAEGVTCEVCHGAGSLYKKFSVMMDRKSCVKNGLVIYASPDSIRARCLNCHADAHGNIFDFKTAWDSIKHNKPDK